ncbi:MAG: peptide chain release factor 1 [Patescibacteria group bacterium]|nr:peptide chain release factor 1 [Patescibacteria group bacterium]
MTIEELKNKIKKMEQDFNDPQVFNCPEKLAVLQKEYQKIKKTLVVLEKIEKIKKEINETEKILNEDRDEELLVLAEKELERLKKEKEKLEKELAGEEKLENKSVIVEIRAGTGGEEAALFAADLFRMYSKFAEKQGWTTELFSTNRTGIGGFKEVIFRVSGQNVWLNLKNEAGVHRVQRIPVTEKSGRIHTSTASVAILPEANESEISIRPEDLKIETFRASAKGGQNVQKVESAVRITHLPTGLTVSCQEERSQARNKEKALKILRTRLLAQEQEKKEKEISQTRKEQIKKAERADKIRTYNFPQNRVTDHRLNKSWYNLAEIMDGNLEEIVEEFKK